MNDIQLIGGDGVEEILSSHTNIFDRYGASMYFSKFSERHDLPENTRLWYSRAALYEFKAGLETISSCFQEQWARKAWDNSEVKAKLRSDVLMKCIKIGR